LLPKARPSVSGYQTPAEEREAREIRSVALAQPHRRGSDDPKAGSPLWEACSRLRLRQEIYEAGEQYGEISMNYKATIDISGPSRGNAGESSTEEQQAVRATVAKDRYWKAINVLRRAHPMAQGVIERVCYDQRPLSPHDDEAFKKGAFALAIHLQTLKLGINEGKD
jgi:hypothetical protein